MPFWFPHPPPAQNPVFLQPKYYEKSTGFGVSRLGLGSWLVRHAMTSFKSLVSPSLQPGKVRNSISLLSGRR